MRMTLASRIATLSAALACSLSAHANLLTNGSFETGPAVVPPPPLLSFEPGSTAITGWTVTAGNIDYGINGGGSWTASEGARSIDLNGNTAATIVQSFATVVGSTYQVLFDLAGNFYGGSVIKPLRVFAAGQSQDYSFDSTGRTAENMGWTTQAFVFTASTTSTTLSFESLDFAETSTCDNINLGVGPACFGAALDNVRADLLQVVPEPATIALLGVALAGFGFARRRKLH